MSRAVSGFALLLVLLPLHSWASEQQVHAEHEVLVRFQPTVDATRIAEIERDLGLELLGRIPHLAVRRYRTPPSATIEETIGHLSGLAEVEFAEPNLSHEPLGLPTDPLVGNQWSLHNTGQAVNDVVGPADVDIDWPEALSSYAGTSRVVVAVVDSGISLFHPDLFLNRWINEAEVPDGLDNDGNGFVDDISGWDFFDNDPLAVDENGHGTLVASLIGGVWNTVGVAGVSPHVELMSLRLFNDLGTTGATFVTDFVDATTYAALHGARIINYSAGRTGGPSGTELAQLQWLDDRGVLLVAAAGNGGADYMGDSNDAMPFYPASYSTPNVIAVAAVDRTGSLAPFSNYGAESVDIAAPGTEILGADISRSTVWSESFETGAPGWTVGSTCHPLCPPWSLFPDWLGNTWLSDGSFVPFAYSNFTNSWADSPWIPLPPVGPLLEFREWHELGFLLDLVGVEVSTDGVAWTPVHIIYGYSLGLPPGLSFAPGRVVSIDLSRWAGASVKVRFRLVSDGLFVADGIYIDDWKIKEVDVFEFDGSQFRFMAGTSFAAPFVSGVAALVMSQRPDLSHRQVRELILSGADPAASLAGKVASGGRLNAHRTLLAAIQVPEATVGAQSATAIAVLVAAHRARRGRNRILRRRQR